MSIGPFAECFAPFQFIKCFPLTSLHTNLLTSLHANLLTSLNTNLLTS